MRVQLTMLNGMASPDFGVSLARHVAWGLTLLDLKDSIFGKDLLSLTDGEAAQAAGMIHDHGLQVYCLSSGLFHADVEEGRERFTENLPNRIARLVELARILQPRIIRLLGAASSHRSQREDAVADIERRHPWLIEEYRRAVDCIAEADFLATIENETRGCILSGPNEVRRLFQHIDRPGRVVFTWDVQNMWQAGTWPTTETYAALEDLTGYVHLKGGDSAEPGGPLRYRCALEDASYDVRGIVRNVVASGRVPVICLNPPHGQARTCDNESNFVERDLRFIRALIGEEERNR